MKKVIVTTTINPPTEALVKFSKLDDWKLIVVGDLKTPHKDYQKLKNIIYLSPEQQEKMSKNISDIIGWNCIQRRNFGFMLSHKLKAEIIATVDDDNIPLKNWGKNILVGKKIKVKIYNDNSGFFDPLSVTEHKNLWHRGFPVQLLKERSPKYKGIKEVHCLVQADFWNGDPDIDAICRISLRPEIKFKKFYPFSSKNLTPFNSQNTFIHKSLLKHYLMFPGIGRMDDIWAAYYIQQKFKRLLPFIVFSSSSVYQNRNVHNYVLDLKKEIIGYEKTIFFKNQKVKSFLPKSCLKLINLYRDFFI
jgi:hypothetical protein